MAKKNGKEERQIVSHRADNYIELYSNNVEIKATYFDFEFIFGKIKQATPEKLDIENRTAISMSPQLAKTFLRIFVDNLQKYEDQYGLITTPKVPRG